MKLIKDLGTKRNLKDNQMKRQALFYCEYCNSIYEPFNCQWITMAENERKRSNLKLNWNTITEIREKFNTGKYNYNNLSKIYRITRSHMRNIILNNVWNGGDYNFN